MKEDYLWDKTGSDPDVEMIENALQAFRFQATQPPAITSTVISLPEKRPFGFLRLGFALAFAASLIVVISLIWLRAPNTVPDRHDVASESSPGNVRTPLDPVGSVTPMMKPPASKSLLYNARQPLRVRSVKIFARKRIVNQPAKLTAEEKHAYDQLMLALAITSNELRIVRDKIDGREERIAADDK